MNIWINDLPAELERKRLEEKAWEEEEQKKLLEMEEAERLGYLLRRKEEEEERRKAAEQRKRRNEEAAMRAEEEAILQAELFARYITGVQKCVHLCTKTQVYKVFVHVIIYPKMTANSIKSVFLHLFIF